MTVVVVLTVRAAAAESFHRFEREAARVMAKYGGAIERAILVPGSISDDHFREVHIVTFPDTAAFRAYRADPELAAYAALRAEAIIATEILEGHDVAPPH